MLMELSTTMTALTGAVPCAGEELAYPRRPREGRHEEEDCGDPEEEHEDILEAHPALVGGGAGAQKAQRRQLVAAGAALVQQMQKQRDARGRGCDEER